MPDTAAARAAIGLFTAGSVVSIYHGITQLGNHEPESDYRIAYVVLGIAFVLEGISFLQARREAAQGAHKAGVGMLRHVSRTSNPTLRAVFAEDAAALAGLAVAAAGILAHQLTGDAVYDAVGSILVGLLLGVIAIFLIGRNRDFLSGQAVDPAIRSRVLHRMLEHPQISRITYLHLEYAASDRVFVEVSEQQKQKLISVDLSGSYVVRSVPPGRTGSSWSIESTGLPATIPTNATRPAASRAVVSAPV